jgi:hypothetical protein
MKKLIFVFLIACVSLLAESVLKIEKIIDNGYGAVATGSGVEVGQSGIVLSWLNSDKKAIVAKTIVTAVNGNEARLKFEVFDDLAQDSLPRYVVLPNVGDEAMFGLFEGRAAIVAKNQGDYLKATSQVSKLLVHPDLMAFRLYKNRKGEPTKQSFMRFCADYSVGNIYFAIGDKLYKTDCGSMNVVSSDSFTPSGEKGFESPFFHRLGKIETGYLGIATESVDNYESYYKQLLGVR